METWMLIVLGLLAVWNLITFIMYAVDKSRAKNRGWRIKESTLVLVAFLMGGVGAFCGMTLLRHKTKHIKFTLLVPVAVVVNIGVLVAVWMVF